MSRGRHLSMTMPPHSYTALADPPHSPSSTDSLLSSEAPIAVQCDGSHRVKYRGAGPHTLHDCSIDSGVKAIDVSLVLPHFRARNQPLSHRLSMFVGNDSAEPIKVKVCRNFTTARSTKFHLEVHSSSGADVTIWLPSDFRGVIHRSSHCKRATFSSGFTNRIMSNVELTQSRRPSVITAFQTSTQSGESPYSDIYVSNPVYSEDDKWFGAGDMEEDEVLVHTSGQVTFRMWDVQRGEPEARYKETCKRMFGFGWCMKRSPEVTIDWDFLLDD